MGKNQIITFTFTKALSYLGGLWSVLSVTFGALIYWVLYNSFWKKLALKIMELKYHESTYQNAQKNGFVGLN